MDRRRLIMAENWDRDDQEKTSDSSGSSTNRWLIIALFAMVVATGIAFGYGYHQQGAVNELTSRNTELSSNVNQMQGQLDQLTSKLNEVSAAQAAAAAAAQTRTTPAGAPRRAADDKRLKQLQAQLVEQQKQLKDTQDSIAQARSELEGNLSSTRDELNGSIALTHEELVELQKRGERDFFEFDLAKSKQFQHAGPIMLSLRGADAKHKRFDLAMIVDDNQMDKKRVNLFEPIWIHTENASQPVQVVVNKIEKNHVHGYVSAPKYRPSQSGTGATGSPDIIPPADQNSAPVVPMMRRPRP
jgi:outer membrane murein-binding lipoprotein Lpp